MASAGEVTRSDVLFVTAPRTNEPEWTKQLSTFTPEGDREAGDLNRNQYCKRWPENELTQKGLILNLI